MSAPDLPSPATIALARDDQTPAARLIYLALATTDATTMTDLVDETGFTRATITSAVAALREAGLVRGTDVGPGPPAATYAPLVPCPEADCDGWYLRDGISGHIGKMHSDTNAAALSVADPEDLGLSPLGERRADGGER